MMIIPPTSAVRAGMAIEQRRHLLRLLTTGYGTLLPSRPCRAMSVIGCRPADICSLRVFRILTPS